MSVCNGHPPILVTGGSVGAGYGLSTPLPYMVYGDPESGTDYSLKEVNAYIIWYRVHTWGSRVNATSYFLCSPVYIYK